METVKYANYANEKETEIVHGFCEDCEDDCDFEVNAGSLSEDCPYLCVDCWYKRYPSGHSLTPFAPRSEVVNE